MRASETVLCRFAAVLGVAHVLTDQRRFFCLALVVLTVSGCDRPRASAVPLTSSRVSPILLFNGTGTSPNDIAAIETLLLKSQISYSTANSAQLDEMSAARLRTYRLVVIPGGDFTRIGMGLKKDTATKLRDAVRSGVNYLGICGGAFFAGRSPYNGLNLTSGVQFGFYSAEARGTRKAAVPISGAGTPTLDQYWEDGPALTGWGSVIGRYPDGTPAVVQGQSGGGWMILSGVHPEAPENWRGGVDFDTPASVDHDYAIALIRAALERRPLPHF
ncbi:MAG TPA: BPL-N domain-containing protein [Thermoanaerobaculia bacterium]|jgi:hypothetical protein|nr:BPL-N domain-containing protein [Thermoanaerobaculia bacterium]